MTKINGITTSTVTTNSQDQVNIIRLLAEKAKEAGEITAAEYAEVIESFQLIKNINED